MDYVTIEDFRVSGVHGYFPEERTKEQDFTVSLSVGVDLRRAGQSDSLTDTIDYDLLKRIVTETFARESRYLVESLAEEICGRILSATPAREVTVTIKKMEVWENGTPGVTLIRKAS